MVEDKAELASLLEAEKSRRRLLEQRFNTAQEEAEKLRCDHAFSAHSHACLCKCSAKPGSAAGKASAAVRSTAMWLCPSYAHT